MKNWIVISITLLLSLLCGYFLTDLVTLFKYPFWSHMDTKHYVFAIFLLHAQGLFAEKSSLESLDSLLGLDS